MIRLYGNDLDETTTPVEQTSDGSLVGTRWSSTGRRRSANRKIAARTVSWSASSCWTLVSQGTVHVVCVGDTKVGTVTSGTHTPFLKKAIGMAYVSIGHAVPGADLDIDIRGRRTRARVVPMPFYKRPRR
jgi:aminomethyltransferase